MYSVYMIRASKKLSYQEQVFLYYRRMGAPLFIPSKTRLRETLERATPWILWLSCLHLCYTFATETIGAIAQSANLTWQNVAKGSLQQLPEEDLFIGAAILTVCVALPAIVGVVITLAHRLVMRTPRWLRYILLLGALYVASSIFSIEFSDSPVLEEADVIVDGVRGFFFVLCIAVILAVFVGIDTLLGWSFKHTIHQLASLPPMIAKVLPVLMISVLFIFVNADVWKLATDLTFPRTWAVCGAMAILALFVIATTSYERARRLLGRRGAVTARYEVAELRAASDSAGGVWKKLTANLPDSEQILEEQPVGRAQWANMLVIPFLGQVIQTVFFTLLVFAFFTWFSSIAITDHTIELWVGNAPEKLRILGVQMNYNAVVLKVSMIVSVFGGLSFVATTSSDERYAHEFLEPMVLRVRELLMLNEVSRLTLGVSALVDPKEVESDAVESESSAPAGSTAGEGFIEEERSVESVLVRAGSESDAAEDAVEGEKLQASIPWKE